MTVKSRYDLDELVACGEGRLFGPGNAQLPVANMLMFNRIENINDHGGEFGKGEVEAELDVHPNLWFFHCHFPGDPVMPGCLGLDALWQLLGFFLGWSGGPGKGRALGAGNVKFSGQILPSNELVRYRLDIKRVIRRGLIMGLANGVVTVDGKVIYRAEDLKVGLFEDPGSAL